MPRTIPSSTSSRARDAVILGEVERTLPRAVRRAGGRIRTPALDEIAGLALPPIRRPGPRCARRRAPSRRGPRRAARSRRGTWSTSSATGAPGPRPTVASPGTWSTSRGCPYGCNWCAKPDLRAPLRAAESRPTWPRSWRGSEDDGRDPITSGSPTTSSASPPGWIERVRRRRSRARDAPIPFTMQSRVNLMTPSAVAALREAGCRGGLAGRRDRGRRRSSTPWRRAPASSRSGDATRLLQRERHPRLLVPAARLSRARRGTTSWRRAT